MEVCSSSHLLISPAPPLPPYILFNAPTETRRSYDEGDWRFEQHALHYAGWAASANTNQFARDYKMKGIGAAKIYRSHSADTAIKGS